MDIWTPEYLDRMQKPLPMLCMVCQYGEDKWIAVAPELPNALGVGADLEDAVEELQEKLVHLKEWVLEMKHTSMLRSMLLQPSLEHAMEQIKKEADLYDHFRSRAKRILWRMVTV